MSAGRQKTREKQEPSCQRNNSGERILTERWEYRLMGLTMFHINNKKRTNQGIRGRGKETILSRKSETGLLGCVKHTLEMSELGNTRLLTGRCCTNGGVGSCALNLSWDILDNMTLLLKKKKKKQEH